MRLFKPSKDGREIYLGDIKNGIYSRRIRTQHIFKYFNPEKKTEEQGLTIDKDAFEQKILDQCQYLFIRDTETMLSYSCSVQAFAQDAIQLRDRYFLPLTFWKVEELHQAFKRVSVVERE